ncbi:portal protein [Pseudoalteromonas sp. MM17-2]|uniref:portal protein n=1 Tax=Pseudoalteromonas sp. MM17-2 TaxID=2917753 RepID=UPI001EF6C0AA|nr:portal protein [Pseudoalteromonas sp. MM17-2]
MSEQEKGLASQFKKLFVGYDQGDSERHDIPLDVSPHSGMGGSAFNSQNKEDEGTSIGSSFIVDNRVSLNKLTHAERLDYYQEMAEEPIFDSAIDMHLSHALSVDSRTEKAINLVATDKSNEGIVAELNAELGAVFNEQAASWMKVASIFGAHYLRPYCERGKGIVNIESSYYTLAKFVREYERRGQLAGFTNENFRENEVTQVKLAKPWVLAPVKIPLWRPNMHKEPVNLTGKAYSLFDEHHFNFPVETQNYGTSLLHGAFEPWLDMRDGLRSLRASRHNASIIHRLLTVGMEGLTPIAAAQQLQLVGKQLKGDIKKAERNKQKSGVISTIYNTLIPAAGGKNGITTDTQQSSPDIQHIEDIMFHLKRGCSSLGIDASLLGWGDLMSGGLGDGGFFRSSIQAATRANLVRQGMVNCIHRLVDIHLVYKYGKAFVGKDRPYKVSFHSLNTAIEQEQADAMLRRSDYATSIAGVMDLIEGGAMSKSETFKKMVYTDALQLDEEVTAKIFAELKSGAAQDNAMFESAVRLEELAQSAAKKEINKLMLGDELED